MMFRLLRVLLSGLLALLRDQSDVALENLALRQQLATYVSEGRRPRFDSGDRFFWATLSRVWSRWMEVLIFVKPESVVRWHRAGFRRYWAWRSRKQPGRPRTEARLVTLIRKMALENPSWGAPRIHGELLKLGLDVSERTVSRYLPKDRPKPEAIERWKTFLRNHRDGIAAMDFFVVPTVTFRQLYGWFAIGHGRRNILHFGVKKKTPTTK